MSWLPRAAVSFDIVENIFNFFLYLSNSLTYIILTMLATVTNLLRIDDQVS